MGQQRSASPPSACPYVIPRLGCSVCHLLMLSTAALPVHRVGPGEGEKCASAALDDAHVSRPTRSVDKAPGNGGAVGGRNTLPVTAPRRWPPSRSKKLMQCHMRGVRLVGVVGQDANYLGAMVML